MDAEAEACRREARRMQAVGSWVRGPARMQPARRLPLRQAPNESGRRARRVCGAIVFAETVLCRKAATTVSSRVSHPEQASRGPGTIQLDPRARGTTAKRVALWCFREIGILRRTLLEESRAQE